jgi:putative transposase
LTKNKAYKIRIYPNQSQEKQINQTIGSCRFIFNQMLAERKMVFEQFRDDKESLKSYKYKTERELKNEFPFLAEANSRALQQARINLESALNNFFAKRAKFPKFKAKKKSAESYREPNVSDFIEVKDNKIKLLKLGWVKLSYLPKEFTGKIKSVTVSRSKTNQYYVSILTEQEFIVRERKSNEVIGLDLGLTDFCVTSKGEFYSPITNNLKKLEKKIRFWQKKLARQIKGSFRREKTKLKLNKVYEKMKRLQNYYFWHLANKLASENQAIGLETLSINNLKRNRKLSHSIHFTSWGEFLTKLKQKAVEYGTKLYFASQFFASTKTCFNCKNKQEMSLEKRIYICQSCRYKQPRDINSALNLRAEIRNSSEFGENRHGETIRPMRLKFDFKGGFNEVLTKANVHIWA